MPGGPTQVVRVAQLDQSATVRRWRSQVRFLPWTPFCHLDAIALLELFLKFEYQRRVAAGHLFGHEAAEVLRLDPLIQQSISHKLDQRAELLVSQSDWGDQQREIGRASCRERV